MTKSVKNSRKVAVVTAVLMSVVTIAMALCMIFNTVSAYNLLSWDLVDSGKHLDWDGSTEYMTEWNASVEVWEDYKPGVIREDTFWIIEDVTISDFYEESSTMGVTSSAGTIKFNDYHFASMSAGERQKTMTHEIGHALGLGHSDNATSIMRQGKFSQTYINDDDKAGYDAAYARY